MHRPWGVPTPTVVSLCDYLSFSGLVSWRCKCRRRSRLFRCNGKQSGVGPRVKRGLSHIEYTIYACVSGCPQDSRTAAVPVIHLQANHLSMPTEAIDRGPLQLARVKQPGRLCTKGVFPGPRLRSKGSMRDLSQVSCQLVPKAS